MKKLLLILALFSIFIVTACQKSDAEKAGEQYAPTAFQALKDEFKQAITIQKADFACASAEVESQTERTCTYVIHLNTSESGDPFYAFVVVSGDADDEPFTFVQIYGREADYNDMLDTIYSDSFQEDTRNDMETDESIESFDFVADTLSEKAIEAAYETVE